MPNQVRCRDALLLYEPGRLHPHAECDWTASHDSVERVIEALENHTLSTHDLDLKQLEPAQRERILTAIEAA